MPATKAPEDLLRKIRQGNRFLLTSHVNPDGDAIGSELGLARLLRRLGKGAVVWNLDPIPAIYRPLPGSDRVHSGAEPPAGFPEKFDSIVVLECPSLDRTGIEQHLTALPVINIDHHLGNQHYGAVNWVDSAAPAVGEMVFRLAQALKAALEPEIASCLYLTLVTDTGGFRYSNATPAAFEAAAALVREGAHPEQVAQWLYESQPVAVVRLLGEMLQTLTLHHGGRIATVRLDPEMFARAGAAAGDSEGLIDHPRSIAGVDAVALIRRREDGSYKVSLRSRGEVDVEKIARHHGGGGHRNAAGYALGGEAGTAEVEREAVSEVAAALPAEASADATSSPADAASSPAANGTSAAAPAGAAGRETAGTPADPAAAAIGGDAGATAPATAGHAEHEDESAAATTAATGGEKHVAGKPVG
ncbi:MAG TPA: bifunctional oligoribonuclease/PAP phosphatase NrnA [Thermoanaerobaculia bacterium]|nr:bifunctional oligoribonuclease/PAP phosphatase NrnA [Thermoanaerobaculia bacterium]